MSDDVVERAKAALEGTTGAPWVADSGDRWIHGGVGEYDEVIYPGPVSCGSYCYGGSSTIEGDRMPQDMAFIAAARSLVPELVAEVEKLRSGGAWVEHVERMNAMKRERDGECICNHGPDIEGPDEFCPWHGRSYNELLDGLESQAAEVERLRQLVNEMGAQR